MGRRGYDAPMDTTKLTAGGTALVAVPDSRSCTRCDDRQQLLGGASGLGKYQCDSCQLVVGFDLEADPAEFIISRGSPSRYTKEVFGSRLLPSERRLP